MMNTTKVAGFNKLVELLNAGGVVLDMPMIGYKVFTDNTTWSVRSDAFWKARKQGLLRWAGADGMTGKWKGWQ